jgi:short-subunit dehydrogenase
MPKQKLIHELISLHGHRALITGAAAGIGRAIAHRFAEAGAELYLVDRDAALNVLSKELGKASAKLHSYVVDLSKKTEITQLWTRLVNHTPTSW